MLDSEALKWLAENYKDPPQSQCIYGECYVRENDLAYEHKTAPDPPAYNTDVLLEIGGDRLVKLYECGGNFELASRELGISRKTLNKYIERLRKKMLKDGITATEFDSKVRNVANIATQD